MTQTYWREITQSLDLPETGFHEVGIGDLPSVYAVSDFASATIAAAGVALADLQGAAADTVHIDRRRASLWFDMTLRPVGWELPSIWDPIAGVYQTRDGFIRLHTNAPHHRDAALRVLGCDNTRDVVKSAVAGWLAEPLEAAIVAEKGCAAMLRSAAAWQAHPQGIAVQDAPLIRWHDGGTCTATPLAPQTSQPLQGLRVLDLTRVLAGPVATRFLAGFGADVLRIDPPHWNEPAAEAEVTLGKRCAGLDLRRQVDLDRLRDLIRHADVLLHGYRPGALEGLGLGAEERRALKPDLVDVSLSAYGRTGLWANRRGFDSLVQMSCGIAAEGQRISGAANPIPLPVQALDHGTGYLMAAAALRGLAMRQDGRAARADLSLARSAQLLMTHKATLTPAHSITAMPKDFGTDTEHTSWGPAHRVKPPLTVSGQIPVWALPAGHLRRHTAQW